MSLVLPTPESNPGKAEWSEVYANDKALKEAVEDLEGEFKAALTPITWYPPKAIATEESRTNTSFGTLTTADQISNVELSENGLLLVDYRALWKQSVSTQGQGRAAIFLNETQLKFVRSSSASPEVQEASRVNEGFQTKFGLLSSDEVGLVNVSQEGPEYTGDVATGQSTGLQGPSGPFGGFCVIFAAAGTYNVSIRYKALTGSVSAKNRTLRVAALG
jgi:hypothetical protein